MNILRIIQRWASEWSWSAGRASHVSNGHQHQVIIHDIRVIVVPDGDHWFAQSLDINYGTGGATIDEAQDNFERGLSLTIKANLDRQGSIDRIKIGVQADGIIWYLVSPRNPFEALKLAWYMWRWPDLAAL